MVWYAFERRGGEGEEERREPLMRNWVRHMTSYTWTPSLLTCHIHLLHCCPQMLVPADHISRSPNDTYYVSADKVLRCHTSAHQVRSRRGMAPGGVREPMVPGGVREPMARG